MSDDANRIHFERLVDRARIAVRQSGLTGLEAEVVYVVDVSASMYKMVTTGLIQELSTELLALAVHFDDDGSIPAWAFGEAPRYLGPLTVEEFPGFVDRKLIRTGADFQSACYYSPVIDAVCRHFFPEEWARPARQKKVGLFRKTQWEYPPLSMPRRYPVFVVFVTAGDCEDPEQTAETIRRASHLPVFWQFAGVTAPGEKPASFRFLKRLDKLKRRYVDNCGFFEPGDVRDSFALFGGLLNEFPQYLELPQVKGMLHAFGVDNRARGGLPVEDSDKTIMSHGRSGKTLYLDE